MYIGRRPSSICDAPAPLNSRNLSQDDLLARLRTVQEVCLGETGANRHSVKFMANCDVIGHLVTNSFILFPLI